MTVLISGRTSEGKKRTCNSRCHNAKGQNCHCLCQGINHGVGLAQATENTQKMAEELVKQGMKVARGASQTVLPL